MTWPTIHWIRLGPTARRRLALHLCAIAVVLLARLPLGQPTTAHADTLNPCLYISLSNPTSADCAPPDLLNLNQPLYSATITQTASLSDLEAQAVTSIIKEHGLAGSDVNAVLSWGRADAQAALFALLVQAIKTPAASRSADQQNAVAWLTAVAQRRAEQAAQDAGLEYVKWAGLNENSYWSYINANASQSDLQSFLSGTPNADFFCNYHSPAPYASDYTAYPPSTNPADCITAYTNPFSVLTLPPTPSYDQFVKWGEADATYALLNSADYQSAATSIALGLEIGLPLGAAAAAGATAGSVVAAAVSYAGAFASIGVEESVLDTVLLAVVEAAGDTVLAVGTVIAALATAIIAGIDVSNAAKLPGQLATLITSAATTPPDLTALESTTAGAQTLYSLFVGATLPTPLNQTCDNSHILPDFYGNGGGTVIHTNECLNPTPIPPAAASDPRFVVQKQGGVTSGTSSTITWTDKAAGTTATARLSGNWFVEQVNGATVQTLHITYTDWNGAEQTAWLVGDPTDGYAFLTVASLANAGTTVDPSTCVAAGLCSYGPTIDFVGGDGTDYQASVQAPGPNGQIPGQLAPGTVSGDDPTGSPIVHSHVCPAADEGCDVEFDANTFGPLDAFDPNNPLQIVSPMTYTWEFEQPPCYSCLVLNGQVGPAYTAPIPSTGTTDYTFQRSGTFAVRLTATDANGKQAVDTFSITIGDVPPTLSLDPACPQANPCDTRTAEEGTAMSLGGTITHAGTQDVENVSVNWGDGSGVDNAYCGDVNSFNVPSGSGCGPGTAVSGAGISGLCAPPGCKPLLLTLTPDASQTHIALSDTHTYARAGTYYVTVSVTDQSGATDSRTFVETVTNPAPTTSSLSLTPASTGACSPIVNPLANLIPPPPAVAAISSSPIVTVTGSGFVPGSTVYWNGAPLTTTYLSSCQVMAQVPTTDTASATVGTIAVANAAPGGGVSNPQLLYITPDGTLAGAALATSASGSATVTVGGHSNIIGGVGLPGTPGTLSADASGAGIVAVAQYGTNPLTTTPPSAVNAYFDVFVPAGSSFSSVQVSDCNLGGGSVVYYDDDATKQWTKVSRQSYDASAGCVSFTLDTTSTPSLSQLSGTVFGVRNVPPTVTDPGAQSVQYGSQASIPVSATDVEAADKLTIHASGLPAGLSLHDNGDGTGTISGTVTSPAGVYTATLTANDGISDSSPATVTFTITPAPLTISADDQSTVYGQSFPSFTVTPHGLVNGDTLTSLQGTLTVVTTATQASAPGTYTLTPGGLSSPNYSISYEAGTLTISQDASTVTLASSANPAPFGQAVTLMAKVGAAAPGSGTPTGTVTFLDGGTPIGTAPLKNGQASLTTATLLGGTHKLSVSYGGDAAFTAGTSDVLAQAITFDQTINGTASGPQTIHAGQTVLINGTVNGPLTVQAGASVALMGAHVSGPIQASGAGAIALCGSTVNGPVSITGSTGFVRLGAASDDTGVSCAGDTLSGPLSLSGNTGGVEVAGATIAGPLSLTNNTAGAPPVLAGNTIGGPLSCWGNTPTPTADGQPNTVSGPKSGQCAGL